MALSAACSPWAGASPLTFGSLLDEMTDPERLTRLPERPYRLAQASSYDRRALAPNTAEWFANSDWSQFVRTEVNDGRTEYVLLDADGPGAIVRFWATVMGSGNTMRIYLDGAAVPAVEGSLTQLIGRGAWADAALSFVAPIRADAGTGHNLYLPIPFRHHCKVTVAAPSKRLYYNIGYRTYEPGAEVETYATNAMSLYSAEYARALSALSEAHPSLSGTTACHRVEGRLDWGGGSRSITLRGPAEIRLLRFRLAAPDLPQALRSTLVELDFDDERGAVCCPLGDLFGTGCSVTTGGTWFAEAAADGTLALYWPMPYRREATLRVINHGQQPVEILQGEVWTGAYSWDETRSMHFHAGWRDYVFEDSVSLKGEDLNYVTLLGRGRLVGDSLSVFNDASDVPNSYLNWWGEGDEKICVDNEAFPSHFGTGTEDYYGYAWCLPQAFNTPFVAQPTGAGNDRRGLTLNSRVRLLDDIPYTSSLRFDMEFLSWRTGRHRFAPTVYWYARPGGRHLSPSPLAASLLPVPRTTSGSESASLFCPLGLRMEGEVLAVANVSGGAVSCVTSNGLGLSADQCLRWHGCGLGSQLDLTFTAAFTGQCALAMRVLTGPLAGSLQVRLNGVTTTNSVNLYAAKPAPLLVPLGTHTICGGANTLTLSVTGVPPATNSASFALDYLQNEGPYYVSRVLPVVRERYEGERVPAVVSCGSLTVESPTNGLSGGAVLLWVEAAVGGVLAVDLVSDRQRQVHLAALLLGTTNGATCDIRVNGAPACQNLNLCRPGPEVVRADLGEHVLQAGTNAVTVWLTGCASGLDPWALSLGLDGLDIGSLYARLAARSADTPLIGPREDPDGDGMSNLAEYAFGGNPGQRDGAELWPSTFAYREGALLYPGVTYRRRQPAGSLPVLGSEGLDLQVDGVRYQVQQADALGPNVQWASENALGPTIQTAGPPDDDTGKTVRVRVRACEPLPAEGGGSRFIRVGLSEP